MSNVYLEKIASMTEEEKEEARSEFYSEPHLAGSRLGSIAGIGAGALAAKLSGSALVGGVAGLSTAALASKGLRNFLSKYNDNLTNRLHSDEEYRKEYMNRPEDDFKDMTPAHRSYNESMMAQLKEVYGKK